MNERALWYFAYTFSTDLRGLGPVRIHSVPFKGHTNCFWFITAYISFLIRKSPLIVQYLIYHIWIAVLWGTMLAWLHLRGIQSNELEIMVPTNSRSIFLGLIIWCHQFFWLTHTNLLVCFENERTNFTLKCWDW